MRVRITHPGRSPGQVAALNRTLLMRFIRGKMNETNSGGTALQRHPPDNEFRRRKKKTTENYRSTGTTLTAPGDNCTPRPFGGAVNNKNFGATFQPPTADGSTKI